MDQISAEDVEQTGAPELPSGQIPVQAPPDRAEPTGMGSILATVIPMMGSMGVMVFMAMSQGQNTRMLFMAGAMVIAMLSMVAFNIYRQCRGIARKSMGFVASIWRICLRCVKRSELSPRVSAATLTGICRIRMLWS